MCRWLVPFIRHTTLFSEQIEPFSSIPTSICKSGPEWRGLRSSDIIVCRHVSEGGDKYLGLYSPQSNIGTDNGIS